MNVHELIRRLEQYDQLTEVVFNASEKGQEGFILVPIESVEDIESDMGEKFIMISPTYLHGTTELSNN